MSLKYYIDERSERFETIIELKSCRFTDFQGSYEHYNTVFYNLPYEYFFHHELEYLNFRVPR